MVEFYTRVVGLVVSDRGISSRGGEFAFMTAAPEHHHQFVVVSGRPPEGGTRINQLFLRCKVRRKDGKQHRYWSVVENARVAGGAWCSGTCCTWARSTTRRNWPWRRSIAVLENGAGQPRTLSLFPEDRCDGLLGTPRLSVSSCRNCSCAGGACWLALLLWRELQLDQFWCKRLGVSRKSLPREGGGRPGDPAGLSPARGMC